MHSLESLLPESRRLRRGAWIAVALWLFFMVVTAYASAATLLSRITENDVMKAASGVAWSGRIALEIAGFIGMQFLLHLAFAALTWVLALCATALSGELRRKFGRMVVGWFCVLAGGTLAFNALWFPRTLIGAYYHDAMARMLGPWPVGEWIYRAAFALCGLLLVLGLGTLWRAAGTRTRSRAAWAGGAVTAALLAAVLLPGFRTSSAAAAPQKQPNIILLGIDSLRLEQLKRNGGTGVTPNLDRFLANADVFADATTPVARTFPSWSAILSGRAPTVTGARFNLAERSSVSINPTFGDVLRQAGYRTVYSTDEVRFANIDETYGFDQVVTPRIGASDFLIGTYNELPLASLVINTRLGRLLFPFSYSNRGVATMFLPETFPERIDREVEFDGPTLFICHLTAAHWPYYTGDVPFGVSEPTPDNERPLYRLGLQTADRMFGEMVAVLERKGALKNALVIVLSDHGEALRLPSDSFFDTTFTVKGLRAPLQMYDYGHGQSVLSKSQYHVLLSFRTFGPARPVGPGGRTLDFPATVEDIAPTLLDYAGIPGDPLKATGQSLLPYLASSAPLSDTDRLRIRYTETDLAVLPAPGGGVDEDATARQNSKFFTVDPKTARMHIRADFAPLAKAYKERAAFAGQRLLAAMPAGPYAHQYLLFDFSRNYGELLMDRPGADDPEGQRLWDALATHYRGELHKPAAITPEDWPRIEDEWTNYLVERSKREARPADRPPGA